VSDLYAATNKAVTTGTATVEILEVTSTTAKAVLSCTISGGASSCTSSGSVVGQAGSYLAVKVNAAGGYRLETTRWRVSFRF